MPHATTISLICLALATISYLASLVLPAISLRDGGTIPGIVLFIYGPLGLANFKEPRWLANSFLFAGFVLSLGKSPVVFTISTGLLALGAAIAVSCLIVPVLWVTGDGSWVYERAFLSTGAYVWMAAHILATLSAVFAYFGRQQ